MSHLAIQLAVGLVTLIIVVTVSVYVVTKVVEWRAIRRELKEVREAASD